MTPRTGRPPKRPDDRRDRIWLYASKIEKAEIVEAKQQEDPENKLTLGRWITEKILQIIRNNK